MEVCPGFELIAIENAAALGHDLLELSKRPEVPVRERLIQDGPEVFSRLKLRGVAGQVDQPEALGHNQVRCGVPAGVVENEHDDPLSSRPGLAGKQRQQRGEERLGDPVRYVPEHLAGDRLHEGGDVQPLVAVVAERDRPLTLGGPHPAQDRLQADAVLVHGPDLDRLVRVLGPLLGDGLLQLLWNGPPLPSRSLRLSWPGNRRRSGRCRSRFWGLILARTAAAWRAWTTLGAWSCGGACAGRA